MTISTLDGYIASSKQILCIQRSGARTTQAGLWFQTFDLAGKPGAGTLAGTSTTTGVVPTDATAGCPPINAFGVGATGYISQVEYGNTVACRMRIYDMLWKGGAYAFNANTSGNTPASYSSRVPNSDYSQCELWYEQVTAGTGIQSVNVTYNDQDGTSSSTGAFSIGTTGIVGRMHQIPLAAGDSGIQGVTGVTGSTATAGTFNLLVLRPVWTGRVRIANDGGSHGLDMCAMPEVYDDSALIVAVAADSTSSGVIDIRLTIANA